MNIITASQQQYSCTVKWKLKYFIIIIINIFQNNSKIILL